PTFAKTVILLLAHGDEGAYGVVVNRPIPVDGVPFPVFIGGPCPSPGLILLHGHPDWAEQEGGPSEGEEEESQGEILPGVFVGDAACLKRASEPALGEARRVRVFRGYSGWGPGQLEGELARNAWAVMPATAELLFEVPAEALWEQLR